MTMSPLEDDHLLAEDAAVRDEIAWEQLRFAHERKIKAYIRVQADWGGDTEIEDLADKTWEKVHAKFISPPPAGFDPNQGSFYNWVTKCFARYVVIDHNCRGRKKACWSRRDSVDEDENEDPIQSIADTSSLAPADAARLFDAFGELMSVVFRCGGYPHQVLAFALSRVIYGRRSPNGMRGDSQRVHELHGSEPLEDLLVTFCNLYLSLTRVEGERRRAALGRLVEPTRLRFSQKARRLTCNDAAPIAANDGFASKTVGRTCLNEYCAEFSGGYEAAIPDWSDKVKTATRNALNNGTDACPRCKLRDMPPCDAPGGRQVRRIAAADLAFPE
jgi:DNA-directed RNA polymerase specialized sigma24 family protein